MFFSNLAWLNRYAKKTNASYIFRAHQTPELLWRVVTSSLRTMPDLHIVGEMKCGTTALATHLAAHPHVSEPWLKETHFLSGRSVFRADFEDHLNLYRTFFSTVLWTSYERVFKGKRSIQFDATPQRLFLSSAPERVKSMTPNAKIIVMLRDPIERAVSNFRMLRARGKESCKTFEEAVVKERNRVSMKRVNASSVRHVICDSGNVDDTLRHEWIHPDLDFAYCSRGVYANGVRRWIEAFGNENVLILTMESLRDRPKQTMDRVWAFLGLEPIPIKQIRANASVGEKPHVPSHVFARLRDMYADSNQTLINEFHIADAATWCRLGKDPVTSPSRHGQPASKGEGSQPASKGEGRPISQPRKKESRWKATERRNECVTKKLARRRYLETNDCT